ncbi:hypothetical protein [Legionella moravica]|nr:hypothetical protein [Legionella moravica]
MPTNIINTCTIPTNDAKIRQGFSPQRSDPFDVPDREYFMGFYSNRI